MPGNRGWRILVTVGSCLVVAEAVKATVDAQWRIRAFATPGGAGVPASVLAVVACAVAIHVVLAAVVAAAAVTVWRRRPSAHGEPGGAGSR